MMPAYICLQQQEQHNGDYALVPIRYDDRFLIMKWRNEQIYHLRQNRPLTEEDQQNYFDNVVSRLFCESLPGQILFSYLEKGTCIGYGGLVHINWTDRNAEISFIMDTRLEAEHFDEHWSNYLAMLRKVAFDDLGLHKIYTYAFDLHPHLYTMLEANGFVREATLREHCLFNGTYKDVVIHSLWNLAPHPYTTINYTDCTLEQQREILALRNLDSVRRWMVHPEVIAEDDHLRFVERLKGNADRIFMAVYRNGVLVGTYNLTRENDDVWERGIIAAPTAQGKGETEQWERQITDELPQHGIKTLTAKVMKDNGRSIRYHQKLGFIETHQDNDYIYFTKDLRNG
jgi:RimJ/RimL family protein N-acetyltransferase